MARQGQPSGTHRQASSGRSQRQTQASRPNQRRSAQPARQGDGRSSQGSQRQAARPTNARSPQRQQTTQVRSAHSQTSRQQGGSVQPVSHGTARQATQRRPAPAPRQGARPVARPTQRPSSRQSARTTTARPTPRQQTHPTTTRRQSYDRHDHTQASRQHTQVRPSGSRPAQYGYDSGTRRREYAYNDPRTRQAQRPPTSRDQRARARQQKESNAALNGRLQPRLVAAVAVVILVLVGILWFNNRSVSITVDGNESSIRVDSSLEQVLQDNGVQVTAGNYVDVSGSVINKGGGNAFKANVDGSDLSNDDAASYKVHGGESITFSDGDDTTEPYSVEYEDIEPELEWEGDAGIVYYVKQWGKAGKKEIRHGSESGKTAEGDTVQEVQNLVIEQCNPKPANDEKLVALTFDDGPAANYTDEYLDILKEKGVKATFNLIGNQIDEFKDEANRIKDEGHQITSHTWTHAQMTKLSASKLRQELDKTYDKIKEVTGVETTTLRPPYGSWLTDCWLESQGSTSVVAIWTHDSEDWRRPGSDAIVQNCTKDMAPGSIILMHDGGGDRSQDVEALPQIIDAWQQAGYRFVTLSELLQSDDSIPDDVASGDAKMPDDATWPTKVASGSENKGTA